MARKRAVPRHGGVKAPTDKAQVGNLKTQGAHARASGGRRQSRRDRRN
jgi:hypothetical protein